jgi:hypothetical protein
MSVLALLPGERGEKTSLGAVHVAVLDDEPPWEADPPEAKH